MKIVLIPDKFKGSLTSREVIMALSKGIRKAESEAQIHHLIASDGGDGFLDAVASNLKVEKIYCDTQDPLGRKIRAPYLFNREKSEAYVEMAKASGMVLLTEQERNPMHTSTLGTGIQIRHAITQGATKIFLGLGGSATTDGGTGIAEALGYTFIDAMGKRVKTTGEGLHKIHTIASEKVLKQVKNVSFYAVNDVNNPLHGPNGAAFVYAQQKGASDKEIGLLDEGLKHLDTLTQSQLQKKNALVPGSGAAGGAAYGLMSFLGAKFLSGIDFMLNLTDIHTLFQSQHIDLIVTGEGKIDRQTLSGKLIHGVIELGKKYQIPVVAVCGALELDKQLYLDNGLEEVFEIRDHSKPIAYSMENAGKLVEDTMYKFMTSRKGQY